MNPSVTIQLQCCKLLHSEVLSKNQLSRGHACRSSSLTKTDTCQAKFKGWGKPTSTSNQRLLYFLLDICCHTIVYQHQFFYSNAPDLACTYSYYEKTWYRYNIKVTFHDVVVTSQIPFYCILYITLYVVE